MSQKLHNTHAQTPPYYKSEGFDQVTGPAINYGFSGRQGGVSPAPFDSLNVGLSGGDQLENVMSNRALAVQSITGLHQQPLMVHQTHSNDCITIAEVSDTTLQDCRQQEADAIVTNVPNIPIAVQTADCVPILFSAHSSSDDTPIIGAAHAGWKGARSGIIEATIESMIALGAEAQNIHACIGPCIGFDSYEVDQGFYDNFITESEGNKAFFKPSIKKEHFHFNIEKYVKEKILSYEIKTVFLLSIDTYAEKNHFFSHRRATHENRSQEGRQLSTIVIRS